MAGFIRRFTSQPSIETLSEIEAIDIVDLPPQSPTTGIGTGTLLCVGEYEDGPFAVGGDATYFSNADKNKGPREVFGSEDMVTRFGGFGFTYGTTRYQNPCARRHLFELWNGNGFLKLKFCKPKRLVLARVDTSVGEVAFSARAFILGADGPFALAVGQTLSITTDTGGPAASTAVAATAASHTGGVFVASGFVGGEQIDVTVDQNPTVRVTFTSADSTPAQVAARINLALGYTAATVGGGALTVVGLQLGTGGRLVLANVAGTPLTSIGLTAATYAGTGNVSNVARVTPAEVAAIVNGTAGLTAINAKAGVDGSGRLVLYRQSGAGTILVAAGAMATAVGLATIGVAVSAGVHGGGTIAAGTRVRTVGGAEWVTMQTLTIPAGTAAAPLAGPFNVKVRPATDNGSGLTTALNTVVVLADQPSFTFCEVTNPAALSAAKTEPQMDVAYEAAFDRTINMLDAALRETTFSIAARRSDAVARKGRENAIDASARGMFGRKFIYGGALGMTQAQALADVALYRHERLFYTWPGWRVRVPEIAELGVAGGEGFSEDGIITVRGDSPLATIDCRLNPEENPGQDTGLIDSFFDVEQLNSPLDMDAYISLKANGICAPRVDPYVGSIYQSGVTSDLTAGLTTQARRKMADFIQDTLARALLPFSKKLATPGRRDAIRAIIDSFLNELLNPDNPDSARIASYLVDEVSGQTPELTARGIFVFIVKVRTLSSLDAIVLQTEIGEGVVTIQEAA